jgi:hypothetical protein
VPGALLGGGWYLGIDEDTYLRRESVRHEIDYSQDGHVNGGQMLMVVLMCAPSWCLDELVVGVLLA